MKKIRVVQCGCGPIGCSVVKFAVQRDDINLVGAVDIDKQKQGCDLGEIAKLNINIGTIVENDISAVLSKTKPEIVFLTTSSYLADVYSQLETCINNGVNIVSSAEELSFPYDKAGELSKNIDSLAKKNNVTVLATGINPGFVMDAWPLFMTGICQHVNQVKVIRTQDASTRRGPFQKKIGAGCTLNEFNKLVSSGVIKHIGLSESISMIASGLNWELDDITEKIEPIIAKEKVKTDFVTVQPGQVAGVRQVGTGVKAGVELVILEFEASVGACESQDSAYITGVPNIEVTVKGGVHGDIATAALIVNAANRVVNAPPGLITMKDLPMVIARGD